MTMGSPTGGSGNGSGGSGGPSSGAGGPGTVAPSATPASRPAAAPEAPPPKLIAPTGSPGVNCVVDVINATAAPFMSAPPPAQGAAGWVAQGIGGVMGVIGAPQQIIDTAFAALTAPIAAMFPSMPAITLLGMHLAPPHTHTHPPSLIPPAPPIPLPSLGMLVGSGSITVLLGGLPAARAGDIGLAITCGSLAPPFEVYTGSSNVFIGGARAARILDLTKHCNPTSMGAVAAAMGAAGVVAGAAGAIATGNGWAGAQAAADAAILAVKMLVGKDPGLPPGMGVLMGPPVPNVLIGGFPCPPVGEMAVQGMMKALQALGRAVRNFRNSRRGNGANCNGTHPIYLITGENFDSYVDFVSPGLFRWERHYTSARHRQDGPLGFGNRHFYQRSLRVRLHKAVYTDWDGQEFTFPRFEKGSDVSKSNGYVLKRIRRGRYTLAYRNEPVMEFSGGEYDGTYPLRKLTAKTGELELGYDDRGRLVTFTERQWEPRKETRYELRYDREQRISDLLEVPVTVWGAPSPTSTQPVLRAAYAYSRGGDLTEARDALGGKWKYELDWFHRLVKQTDPRGYTYTFKYDANNRCIWASGEDGLWWAEVQYFPEKKKTVYTEGQNATWQFLYDDEGFLHTLIDPYGGKTLRVRDAEGKVVKTIDSGGRETRMLYDADGANVGRMDRFGHLYPTELEEPNLGNPFARELPSTPLARLYAGLVDIGPRAALGVGGSLLDAVPSAFAGYLPQTFRLATPERRFLPEPKTEKDALGRTMRAFDAMGRRHEWQHDATGNVVGEVDGDGKRTEQRTTSWNLVGERSNGVGQSLKYRYSKLEQVTALTDPSGNVTRYDYDLKERLTQVHRLGKMREEYVFDGGDHLVAKKDSQGAILFENEIDPDTHFVKRRRLSGGGEHRYAYDGRGLIAEASTEKHDVEIRRDPKGRRLRDIRDGRGIEHTRPRPGETLSKTFERFVSTTDARERWSVRLLAPNGHLTHVMSDDHGLVLRQCSSGTCELSQYDDRGRIEGRMLWKGATGWSVRYEWSNEGDLLRIVDSIRGTTNYRVDDAHRLVGETTLRGSSYEYELDLGDNLLSKPGLSRVEVKGGNQLVATETESFEYDDRDHLSSRRHRSTGAVTRYAYDGFDMLARIETTHVDGRVAPAWEYSYDALGRRTEARCGTSARHFHWDGDRLAAEQLTDGTLRIYQYGGDGALIPLGFTDYASTDAAPESGRTHYVFSDPVGQPLHIEDATGQVVWWADRIDPYGHIELHPNNRVEYNLRWPGHYFDPETGLHYNRYRYYDPMLGRYLQSDPRGYGGSPTNLYGYPTNPLRDVDVLGLAHPNVADGSTPAHGSGDHDGAEDPPGFSRTRPGSPDGLVPPLDLEGAQLARLRDGHAAHLDAASQADPNAGHVRSVSPADIDLARQPGNTPEQVDARRRILTEFVAPADIANHEGGHDFNQPLFVGPPPPAPANLSQHQIDKSNPRGPGEYFAETDRGYTGSELGIADSGVPYGSPPGTPPVPKTAFPTTHPPNEPYLQSSNAATYDHWSHGAGNPPVWTHGGGVQVVYPRGSRSSGVGWA